MKKFIEWTTPKYIQREIEDKRYGDLLRRKGKKKHICKVTKGAHDFILLGTEQVWLYKYTNYECPCGKKKFEVEELQS
jgi:hypothetical protein